MAVMKPPKQLRTALQTFEVLGPLGQGPAGVVHEVRDQHGTIFAAKILTPELVTRDRRKRLEEDLRFLLRHQHHNLVHVTDFGTLKIASAETVFIVMPLYGGSLRGLLEQGIEPARVLPWFAQILDGVEAAHLQGIAHRDLKPENVLYRRDGDLLVVADFGMAEFAHDSSAPPASVLYVAPEQRAHGQPVDQRADIYALGLMLNQMFTGRIPKGADSSTIGARAADFAYLDDIVQVMVRPEPGARFQSIDDVRKSLLARRPTGAPTVEVVAEVEIEDPLVRQPPGVVSVDWQPGQLTVQLDRAPSPEWVDTFHRVVDMSVQADRGPATVVFRDNTATVRASENEAPTQLRRFKQWLAKAGEEYRERKTRQRAIRLEIEREVRAARLAQEQERARELRDLEQ